MSLPKMYKSCLLCAENGNLYNEKKVGEYKDKRNVFFLENMNAANQVAYSGLFPKKERQVAKASLFLCGLKCDFTKKLSARVVKKYLDANDFIKGEEKSIIDELEILPSGLKDYGSDDL